MPSWTVDDAYIVARYADNVVHHGVLGFNLTGAPVEGITSPLFLLVGMAAALSGASASAIGAFKAVGVLAYLASGLVLLGLARELRASPPAGALVALVYLAIPEHLRHAASGLETEAYATMELACAWAFTRALRRGRHTGAGPLVPCCLILALLRPEGVAVAALALGMIAWRRRRRRADERRYLGLAAAAFAAPLALLEALRWVHFHALVPNTFYAKRGAFSLTFPRETGELFGRSLLDLSLLAAGTVALFAALGAAPGQRAVRFPRGRRRWLALLAVGALVVHAVAYARTDFIMGFALRFALHAWPWVMVLALLLFDHAMRCLPPVRARVPVLGLLGPLALVVVLGCAWRATGPRRETERQQMALYDEAMQGRYGAAVRYLNEHLAPDATLAVYPDAGIVPFRTHRETTDFGRLNDRYLAREARTPADVVGYFLRVRPGALVMSFVPPGRPWDEGAAALLADPQFVRSYVAKLRDLATDGSGIVVYQRAEGAP